MSTTPPSVFRQLIAKDLYLQRWLIGGAILLGAATLVLSARSRALAVGGFNLGFLLYLTTLITFGILVPMLGILKERQDGSRLFVLSLPISPRRYRTAKVAAAALAFLIPWLTLSLGVAAFSWSRPETRAALPFFLALMGFLLGNFATLTALVANTRSEVWAVAGILLTNISVTPFLVHLGRITQGGESAAGALWTPELLSLLALELLWILLAFGLAIWLPQRRRDAI